MATLGTVTDTDSLLPITILCLNDYPCVLLLLLILYQSFYSVWMVTPGTVTDCDTDSLLPILDLEEKGPN